MRRRTVLGGMVAAVGVAGPSGATPRARTATATPILDTLAMPVTPAENRQYSYTDKVSGYFHGRTHTDTNPDWFNGWNITTKRIFQDYALSVDAAALSRASANVTVSPHKMVRRFDGATETLSLLDGLSVLVLGVSDVRGDMIGVALKGDLTDAGTLGLEGVWFLPKEAAGTHLLVAPITPQAVTLDPVRGVMAPKAAGGFYLIHAPTKPEARTVLSRVRRVAMQMLAARASRMEALVSGNNALDAGDPDRTKALLWMRLTTDQLVMKQMGTGIYAGLPWFNDYWGRDTFISITGALFVTGQYDIAADVFRSFAALQDMDPTSKTYGRVPNRARPDGIEYNSADGTPRFIITLADLVSRSGNVALARELWPAVKRAVEGVLKNNVDELGLITHDDADTWMDAKEKGVRAWSPRGNRAIDVQALWVDALSAAKFIVETTWQPPPVFLSRAATKLKAAMVAFNDAETGLLFDHLTSDSAPNKQMRPNAFFALKAMTFGLDDLVARDAAKAKCVRTLWESLVYPWGVATLSQDDPNFYPYHEHWHYYHKDAAYHNGTVWPWLNGAAIEAMLDLNQIDLAWRLFENMNRQALREGAVGSLAECADALPVEGASWTRRTGTFLQAWSNAEQLRVWQECFVGLKLSRLGAEIGFRPRLPDSAGKVVVTLRAISGQVTFICNAQGPRTWEIINHGDDYVFLVIKVPGFEKQDFTLGLAGHFTLKLSQVDKGVSSKMYSPDGVMQLAAIIPNDVAYDELNNLPPNAKVAAQARDEIFAGLDFCKPRLNPNLKSLSVRHDPPLTY